MASSSSDRARGRWRLLREAILQGQCRSMQYSMRRFPGLSLLPATRMIESDNELCQWLVAQSATSRQELLAIVAALQALDPLETSLTLARPSRALNPSTIEWAVAPALCHWTDTGELHIANLEPSRHRLYEYQLPLSTILVRQPLETHISVQDLSSSMDNTGNVGMWDAAPALAVVLSAQAYCPPSVIELGAGQAALPSLSLCHRAQSIVVTDGHPQCVANNRVHALLASRRGATAHIECHVLPWTTDDVERPSPADWMLVADCTHFVSAHAGLLWTMLSTTKVGGGIWMCQPNRDGSWQKFCELIEVLNAQEPVLTVEERQSAVVDEALARARQHGDYEEDRHGLRIFLLTKLRAVEDIDRECILEHVASQDQERRQPNSNLFL